MLIETDKIGDEHRNVKVMYQRLVDNGIVAATLRTNGDSKSCKAVPEINKQIGAPLPNAN